MTSIKLITFDLDNTLWPIEEVMERSEQTTLRYLQQRFPDIASELTLAALHRIRAGYIADMGYYWKNLSYLRRKMTQQLLTNQGIDATTASAAADDAFDIYIHERNSVNYFPHTLELLTQLGKDYTLGAISNGNTSLKLVGLDHLFDFHLSAEQIDIAKPDPAIFSTALAHAQVTANAAMHVGDNPFEDVDGARKAGFTAVWAQLLGQQWPSELTMAPHTIAQLDELPSLLERLNAGQTVSRPEGII